MSNVVEMPPPEDISVDLFGPIRQGHSLIVDGRAIPDISVHERGDMIQFVLDGRFGFTFPREWAYLAANFAANAMAIGAGYASMNAETRDRGFAPRCIGLAELPTE